MVNYEKYKMYEIKYGIEIKIIIFFMVSADFFFTNEIIKQF